VKQTQVLRELSHPHLLVVVGLATDGVRNYGLLMEYMPRSLARVLARAQGSPETANKLKTVWLSIVADLISALIYLHSQGVGHYAIHPKNILFDGAISLKLADYGRSQETHLRQLEEQQQNAEKTVGGADEPRQLYLAPEVLRMESFTPAADVWSVGCVIARLGSLVRLYGETNVSTHIIMMRVSSGELGPADQLANVPGLVGGRALIGLVKACSRLEHKDRPEMSQVQEALQRVARGNVRRGSVVPAAMSLPAPPSQPGSATPPEPSSRPPRGTAAGDKTKESGGKLTEEVMSIFTQYDEDKSGDLSAAELSKALHAMGLPTNEVEAARVVKKYDNSGLNALNPPQFANVVSDLRRFKRKREERKRREQQEGKEGAGKKADAQGAGGADPEANAGRVKPARLPPRGAAPGDRKASVVLPSAMPLPASAAAAASGGAAIAAAAAKQDETVYLTLSAEQVARMRGAQSSPSPSRRVKAVMVDDDDTAGERIYLARAPNVSPSPTRSTPTLSSSQPPQPRSIVKRDQPEPHSSRSASSSRRPSQRVSFRDMQDPSTARSRAQGGPDAQQSARTESMRAGRVNVTAPKEPNEGDTSRAARPPRASGAARPPRVSGAALARPEAANAPAADAPIAAARRSRVSTGAPPPVVSAEESRVTRKTKPPRPSGARPPQAADTVTAVNETANETQIRANRVRI